jgi:DNA (cytosine-5)-methyltransferase 1
MKPRLLDLFCGAGGAAVGYHRAGFEVVGVDINPQPHYPFEFHQADAIEFLSETLAEGFDLIHASPPCQFYSRLRTLPWLRDKEYWDSIPPTRAALQAVGKPFVIENVEGAPVDGITLCGTMFGLQWDDGTPLYRHRPFETPTFMLAPGHSKHTKTLVPGRLLKGRARLNNGYVIGGHQNGLRAMGAMGIDWMTGNELSQAIPPAYTEFIGSEWLRAVEAVA